MPTLDTDALGRRATDAAQSWAPGCRVDDVRELPGGTVSLVYTATVTGGPADCPTVVLKVAPPGLPPVRNRDVLRQARGMSGVGRIPGVRVPSVLFGDPGEPVEVPPFFATGLLDGECVEPVLVAARSPLPPDLVRDRSFAAVRMLAAIRRADPADIGLGDEPEVTLTAEVERWVRTFETVPDELRVGYQACADALLATEPPALPNAIVHGDYRLGNMLLKGADITGIIDWELWAPSDPRIDLGWFLFFTDEADHPSARHGVPSGTPSRAELLAAYEDEVGAATQDMGWFDALTWFREAAMMALIAKLARRRDPATEWGSYIDATTELIASAHKAAAS